MILKIKGENNFFLFQDIVYYFGSTLELETMFPIEDKHKRKDKYKSTSEYIDDSWYSLFNDKLLKCKRTKHYQKIIKKIEDWMITTNIAITTAQKGKGIDGIPSWELEALLKNKPSFLIEHSNNFEIYTVHLDDDIEDLFNEAKEFYEIFEQNFNKESFLKILKRYFIFDENYFDNELMFICQNFVGKKEFFMTENVYSMKGE